MKHYFLKLFSVLLIAIEFSGCSTMFGRPQDEQTVFFDANVPDVEINCSGKRISTPGSLPLRQSKDHACVAEKEGYKKEVFKIDSGTSWEGFGYSTAINTALWGWWTWGVGTVIGWLIDYPSGAMRNLKQDNFIIQMNQLT